ncbi:hypothetical protein HDV06_001870 [Boothiomyces sp. JEL0866]|nr:hypothetical protein HDV06_001870 [Boothiomyces sp. JEL0866]
MSQAFYATPQAQTESQYQSTKGIPFALYCSFFILSSPLISLFGSTKTSKIKYLINAFIFGYISFGVIVYLEGSSLKYQDYQVPLNALAMAVGLVSASASLADSLRLSILIILSGLSYGFRYLPHEFLRIVSTSLFGSFTFFTSIDMFVDSGFNRLDYIFSSHLPLVYVTARHLVNTGFIVFFVISCGIQYKHLMNKNPIEELFDKANKKFE